MKTEFEIKTPIAEQACEILKRLRKLQNAVQSVNVTSARVKGYISWGKVGPAHNEIHTFLLPQLAELQKVYDETLGIKELLK